MLAGCEPCPPVTGVNEGVMSAEELEIEALELAPQERARLAETLLERLENHTEDEIALPSANVNHDAMPGPTSFAIIWPLYKGCACQPQTAIRHRDSVHCRRDTRSC